MTEARELAVDDAEPGLRILAELLEHSARVRRLRHVEELVEGEGGNDDA